MDHSHTSFVALIAETLSGLAASHAALITSRQCSERAPSGRKPEGYMDLLER